MKVMYTEHPRPIEPVDLSSNFQKVLKFFKAFNLSIPKTPTFPDESTHRLRVNLIMEELSEFLEARGGNKIEKATKELTDVLYVVYGYAASMGIDIDHAFRLVHEANLTKLDSMGKSELRADGKVQKSKNYKPVNEKDLVKSIK